nr:hypothetical protein UECTKLIX_UECTKLIX_CDS_0010 [Microvirus sp.]
MPVFSVVIIERSLSVDGICHYDLLFGSCCSLYSKIH